MKRQKLIGKGLGIALVLLMTVGVFGCSPALVVRQLGASPATIYVPDDYSTIQAAVDAANPGDTIIVRDGTHIENIDVSTANLTIQSEHGAEVTIVQAANPDDHVFDVTANYVNISGLAVKGAWGGAPYYDKYGVYLTNANYCQISANMMTNNNINIYLHHSSDNTIAHNTISGSRWSGIYSGFSSNNVIENNDVSNNGNHAIHLSSGGDNNTIIGNNISDNNFGIYLSGGNNFVIMNNNIANSNSCGINLGSDNGLIYLNSFMSNNINVYYSESTNTWNSPQPITYGYNGNQYTNYLGNYWSDYSGSDANGDGIGEIPYPIDSDADSYPLMGSFANYTITDGYDLTIESTAGGEITAPGEGTFTYCTGTVVNLVATPASGYRFVNWTGDVGTIANPSVASTNITMNGNYSVIANFAVIPPIQYRLTMAVSPPTGGTTTPTGANPYTAGTAVNIQAVAAAGYRFASWTAVPGVTFGNATAAATSFTMPSSNVTVTVNFVAIPPVRSECVETATATGTACLTPSHGTIEDLQAVPAPTPLPHGVRLPHGMFTFKVTGLTPGQSVTLTAEFPDPIPTHWVWWKYHDNAWSRVPIGRTTNPRIITFTLTDNVPPGDEDSILGQITDQGGPGDPGAVGWETYPIDKMRVLLPWIALLSAAVAGAGVLALRRRRTPS